MSEELKPCPFCGGEARYNRKQISQGCVLVGYDCEQCGAAAPVFTGPVAIEKSMKISAAKAWNRRAQQPNEPLTVEGLRKMDRKSVYCVGYNEIVLVYIDEHSDLWITFANGDRLTARSCIDSAACKFFARPPEAGEKG